MKGSRIGDLRYTEDALHYYGEAFAASVVPLVKVNHRSHCCVGRRAFVLSLIPEGTHSSFWFGRRRSPIEFSFCG